MQPRHALTFSRTLLNASAQNLHQLVSWSFSAISSNSKADQFYSTEIHKLISASCGLPWLPQGSAVVVHNTSFRGDTIPQWSIHNNNNSVIDPILYTLLFSRDSLGVEGGPMWATVFNSAWSHIQQEERYYHCWTRHLELRRCWSCCEDLSWCWLQCLFGTFEEWQRMSHEVVLMK